MRHLDKSYPYQKPSKNRSSKDINIILGKASVFPAYLAWSDECLERFANRCKNKGSNCFRETLDARRKARELKKAKLASNAVEK